MKTVKIIGVGGIGGCILPVLARFLEYSFAPKEIVSVTLIDGDRFEEKNCTRQHFVRIGNKADVKAEMFREEYRGITWKTFPKYITEENASAVIREGDVVFLCVDNHATRKIVSDRCEELENVFLISGGNDLTDGNIQVYIRKDGTDETLPLSNKFHREISNPRDKNPDELGCEDLGESSPQLLIMNNAIAALMLNAFYAYTIGKIGYDEVYADIVTNAARPVKR